MPPIPGTSNDKLASLLHHPELWRAGQLEHSPEVAPSGFAALDAHLPGGGWPRAALAEILIATAGIGELRLLLPLLRSLSRSEARWLAWINPPFLPYAPALAAAGVEIGKILLVHPKDHQQALWALERASRSGNCSLALAWLDERQLELKDTRRLQLAARHGRTLTCLFRPEAAAASTSMAELRLGLAPDGPADSAVVSVLKRCGGWPVEGIRLPLDDRLGPDDLRARLDAWRAARSPSVALERRPPPTPSSRPPRPAGDPAGAQVNH